MQQKSPKRKNKSYAILWILPFAFLFFLFCITIIGRQSWFYPSVLYKHFVNYFCVATGVLLAGLFFFFNVIRGTLKDFSLVQKIYLPIVGFLIPLAILWLPMNKGVPVLLNKFARTSFMDKVIVLEKGKSYSSKSPCNYYLKIENYTFDIFCIKMKSFNRIAEGDTLLLFGRRSLVGTYIDGFDILPKK